MNHTYFVFTLTLIAKSWTVQPSMLHQTLFCTEEYFMMELWDRVPLNVVQKLSTANRNSSIANEA
eukprot:scaffold82393_cov50-Prasinocladus_malaysianus.AAC.1